MMKVLKKTPGQKMKAHVLIDEGGFLPAGCGGNDSVGGM